MTASKQTKTSTAPKRWIVGVTGASGICYARRLIECAAERVDELHVVFSDAALRVLADEEGVKLSPAKLSAKTLCGKPISNVIFHSLRDIGASIASGSTVFEGMAIVPCSMATLGAIANGAAQNLLHRAAEVTMKEGRRLIIVPRETPLSAIHLENLLKLARLGVSVIPAMPGFYHRPKTIEQLVDMLVMKILDQMGLPNNLVERWDQTTQRAKSK